MVEETGVPGENHRPAASHCWRKPEYPEKTTDLSQVTDRRKPEYPEKTTDLSQVTDRRKPEYPEKTTDLPQVTDKAETGVPGENHRPAASH